MLKKINKPKKLLLLKIFKQLKPSLIFNFFICKINKWVNGKIKKIKKRLLKFILKPKVKILIVKIA